MGSKGKFKSVPKTNRSKAKRWKKGHSSTSNPENKRFREAAKSRFFNTNQGPSALTVDALTKHDRSHTDVEYGTTAPDADQQTAGTFKTWATNWTECTNTTFSKVHRYGASNSALHKEILAILAAVTEVIKMEGGNETETEYFAALMTALESTESEDSLTAIVYLVSLVIKRVPTPVLQSKFSLVAKCFLDLLGRLADSDSTSLLKSLITSLAFLLRAQEAAVWSNSSTQQVYKGLLTFVTHRKPKVRKAAHEAVSLVLKGSLFLTQPAAKTHHPAASMTIKHCTQTIEASGGTGEATETLHTLVLLKSILPVVGQHSVKVATETILKVMTLSNVLVTACGMQALHGLFAAKPESTTLSAELNAQIITALYDFQPSENDVQPMQAWLVVIETAHVNLSRLDNKLGLSHLPRLFSACMSCLLSDKTQVAQSSTKTMKAVLENCIAAEPTTTSTPAGEHPVQKIVRAVESGLSYQFHASWGLVLQLFSSIFQALGKQYPSLFTKSLTSIADLRDSTRFPYKPELDHAMGCAVKSMGPRHVLLAVPLQITGQGDDMNFPRSWLLPVIRDNVMDTELGFFAAYFLPLAARLRQTGQELSQQEIMVAAKSYEALQHQIWSMLPGFCTRPTDLATSFRSIAKVLGTAISDRNDLRMDVMASLRKLINQSLHCEASRVEVSRFAKNFLPILFNLYTAEPTTDKDPTKLAVLETIKVYLHITEPEQLSVFCDKCLAKLQDDTITPYKRCALHDILIGMLPFIEEAHLAELYKLASDHLEATDKTLQKKCYRILEEISAGKSAESRSYVQRHLATIQETLLMSLSSSSPSSKAPRLRCLVNIFKQLETNEEDFLLAVVPEAILCTKEVAERGRTAAYSLLVEMGNAAIRWGGDSTNDPLHEYFKMVMAGFAGSPQMVSATLLALTRILYEFKGRIRSPMLTSIVDSLCLLLKSKSREVVQSALGFTKVLLSAYQVDVLAAHLKSLMSSLVSMKEDCHHHFRFKSKEIYAKLIKKFGYEIIYEMASEGMRKVLTNIRKTQERQKRQRASQEDAESEDDQPRFTTQPESIDELLKDCDSDMEDDSKAKKGKQKSGKPVKSADKSGKPNKSDNKSGKAWLHEGDGGDDIVDFMDTNASKKVMATKPIEKKERKTNDGVFKKAADGRFIITESSEDEGGAHSEDEGIEDLLAALETSRDAGKGKLKQKRKLEDLGGSDDEGPSPAKYKAGGKGIHRQLGKSHTQTGAEYKTKKAKGDVKKKGQPDPYAYVPLDFRNLNKRKQAKVKGQFSNLVRGAQKGAMKGRKGKKKGH